MTKLILIKDFCDSCNIGFTGIKSKLELPGVDFITVKELIAGKSGSLIRSF
jgi:hypothetical protein